LLKQVFRSSLDLISDQIDNGVHRCAGQVLDQAGAEGRVVVIAFGKASRRMADRALQTLSPIAPRVSGLLVTANDDDASLPPLEVIPGGHPLPNDGSFAAAERALELARGAGPDDAVLFLVSGGGSAMLELPIDPAVTIEEWRGLQRALIASGASIERVNAVRMRLSAVKGGRLGAAASRARDVRTLFVSDVPGGVETVASGPTVPCRTNDDHLRRDLDELGLWEAVPSALRARARAADIPQLPEGEQVRGATVTLADAGHCRKHAATTLSSAGVIVDDELDIDDLPYDAAADRALEHLERLARAHSDRTVAVVTTGELSVPLPSKVGVGGRNLQFALRCAAAIAGRPITAISCGTDGIDGNSPAAGAVVDGGTAQRAAAVGLDIAEHLQRCDAYPLLKQLGCTIEPGPTGVNVRDLRVFLAHPN